MANEEPRMVPVKVGWAAVGDGWAVFAESRTDAALQYRKAEQKHREIAVREGSQGWTVRDAAGPEGATRSS